jgi:pimeloyl-ACP methyl ester carboxylesterase
VADPPVERAEVRPGVELAYWRAMPARPPGFPLLLVHGWPETKRIWIRNVEPLAAAGFEVIVPDLRGFGDSGLAPDGFYDSPRTPATCTRSSTTWSGTSAARPAAATSAAA